MTTNIRTRAFVSFVRAYMADRLGSLAGKALGKLDDAQLKQVVQARADADREWLGRTSLSTAALALPDLDHFLYNFVEVSSDLVERDREVFAHVQTKTYENFVKAGMQQDLGDLFNKRLKDMTDEELIEVRNARRTAHANWEWRSNLQVSWDDLGDIDTFLATYVPADEIAEVVFDIDLDACPCAADDTDVRVSAQTTR